MAQVRDLQLAALLDEIASAMRAGLPVEASMARRSEVLWGSAGTAARSIATGLQQGQPLPATLLAIPSNMSDVAAAAAEASEKSGDPSPLERAAVQLRNRSEFARRSRLAWFYPVLLVIVGYLIAVMVMAPMVRRFEADDMQWPPEVVQCATWLQSHGHWPFLAMIGIIAVMLVVLSRRHSFPKNLRRRLFCESLADQLTANIPEDVAIKLAAKISTDRELQAIKTPTLDSPQVKLVLAASELNAVSGSDVGELRIAQLRRAGMRFGERARRHAFWATRALPRMAMAVIGGGIILSYVVWIIAPVYQQVARW